MTKRTVEYIKDKKGKVVGKILGQGHEWDEVDQALHSLAEVKKNQKDMQDLWDSIHHLQLKVQALENPKSWKVRLQAWIRKKIDAMQEWN